MKTPTLFLALFCLSALPVLAQEGDVPAFPQALGFSGGLTSGSGFTYRYLQDWGWQVAGFALYTPETTEQNTGQVYFLGTSVMKQLFFHATKDKNFHALLYGFWGATLSGGTSGSNGSPGLGLSTGPGFGVEFGLFQHLVFYTEVSQGATVYFLRPAGFEPLDAGVLLGGGVVYRF